MNTFNNFRKLFLVILVICAYILSIYNVIKNPSANIIDLPSFITLFHYYVLLFFHIFCLINAVNYYLKILNKIYAKKNIFAFKHTVQNFLELLRYKVSDIIPGPLLRTFFYRYLEYLVLFKIPILTFVKTQVLLFHAIPRILIAIIFFVEIIFYHRIYYFLLSIGLLIIPIVWEIFIVLLRDYSLRTLRIINSIFNVIPSGKLLPTGFYEKYELQKKDDISYEGLDINAFNNTRIICVELYCYVEMDLKPYNELIKRYVTLLMAPLYIIGLLNIILFLGTTN